MLVCSRFTFNCTSSHVQRTEFQCRTWHAIYHMFEWGIQHFTQFWGQVFYNFKSDFWKIRNGMYYVVQFPPLWADNCHQRSWKLLAEKCHCVWSSWSVNFQMFICIQNYHPAVIWMVKDFESWHQIWCCQCDILYQDQSSYNCRKNLKYQEI